MKVVDGLVVPVATDPKSWLDGLIVRAGKMPFPVKLAESDPPGTPATFSVAAFLPTVAGANVTSMVQLDAAASVVVPETQPFTEPVAAAKSLALVPVTEKVTGPLVAPPLLVTVNVKTRLDPSGTVP